MIAAAWALAAAAYETDQLTGRDRPLADAQPFADRVVQDLIDEAARRTDRALGCRADPDHTRDVFVRTLGRLARRSVRVPGRGPARSFGYDTVGAALETGPVDRITFDGRSGLFSEVRLGASPIVDLAGICSTIELAGVRVGTDKLDHFLVNGFVAWRKTARGRDGLAYAVRTERTTLGWWTSDAFSYADLAADLAGQAFYDAVVGPDGYVAVGADGCLEPRRPFRWSDWVRPDWDEVENPSVYTPGVQRAIDAYLDANEADVCAAYRVWADPGHADRLARTLALDLPGAIPRVDPFRLAERCGPPPVADADGADRR